MAATFSWWEDFGPTNNITTVQDVTDVDWKNSPDPEDSYAAFPITAGANSYERWQYGVFTGDFNNVLNGKFAHTQGEFVVGKFTLKGPKSMSQDSDRLAYAQPSTSANANLVTNLTATSLIGSGIDVWFGPTGPAASGKAVSAASVPAGEVFTNYLTTQLQTDATAPAGDLDSAITLTLQYDEN